MESSKEFDLNINDFKEKTKLECEEEKQKMER